MAWKTWKTVALVIGLVVAALVVQAIVMAVRRAHGRRVLLKRSNAAKGPDTEPIFVALVANALEDIDAAADTLHSLFATAKFPLRVFVGLYEVFPDGGAADSAVDRYEQRVRSSAAAFCLRDHVRTLRVPASEALPVLAAHEQVERYLYWSEPYCLTVEPPTRMVHAWDTHCVSALQHAVRVGGSPRVVLTTLPRAVDAADLFSPTARAPAADAPGTFVGLKRLSHHGGMVHLAAYALKHRVPDGAAHMLPALCWCAAFAFSSGLRVQEVSYARALAACTQPVDDVRLHDTAMHAALVACGWRVVHPFHQLALAGPRHLPRRTSASASHNSAAPVVVVLPPAVLTALGIRGMPGASPGAEITARGQIGLSPNPSDAEITAKLGSHGEFLSLLSRVEAHVHRRQQQLQLATVAPPSPTLTPTPSSSPRSPANPLEQALRVQAQAQAWTSPRSPPAASPPQNGLLPIQGGLLPPPNPLELPTLSQSPYWGGF